MIKAFLVEDEPLVRRGIRSMMSFNQFGIELVGEASSGEEALAALEQVPIDLVFTDISMPGMDGLELIQRIRERYPHIRCVVLTCHQDFEFLQRALRMGAIDYMVETQLDDDSATDLLQRLVGQFEQTQDSRGISPVPADDFIDHSELERSWNTLGWLFDQSEFERILAESLHSLQAAKWKQLLLSSFENWLVICPSLEPIRSMEAELLPKESMTELKEWIASIRDEAKRRLRNTRYSEEVIQSIIRSVDLLNKQAGERFTQADICKAINMSISYFSKCFKEVIGLSFVTYVQEMNIRVAQYLLKTTNSPIYQVAEQSGFFDEKYFGKIFRLKTGHSPSEYRMQFRGIHP